MNNILILGSAGGGKTILVKSMLLKDAENAVKSVVVDCEDEYVKLAEQTKAKIFNSLENIQFGNNITVIQNKAHEYLEGSNETQILSKLIELSDKAVESGINKIYLEEFQTRIFIKNIEDFKQYFDKLQYIVTSQIDIDILDGKANRDYFKDIIIGRLGGYDFSIIQKMLNLKTESSYLKFGEYIKINPSCKRLEKIAIDLNKQQI